MNKAIMKDYAIHVGTADFDSITSEIHTRMSKLWIFPDVIANNLFSCYFELFSEEKDLLEEYFALKQELFKDGAMFIEADFENPDYRRFNKLTIQLTPIIRAIQRERQKNLNK